VDIPVLCAVYRARRDDCAPVGLEWAHRGVPGGAALVRAGHELARGKLPVDAPFQRLECRAGRVAASALGDGAGRLGDAQAYFDVAKDPARPFLIDAGDTQVKVVGTAFDVRRRDGQVAVNVQRGLVEVRPHMDAAATPFRLRPA